MTGPEVSRRAAMGALAAICALGLALRVAALDFGLPDVNHPDEMTILNRALSFAKGDLNPHLFLYPTLYYYALFIWEGGWFVVGRLTGVYASLGEFERSYFLDPSRIVLAGRALTACFGVGMIAATYALGARLFGRLTGIGAALFIAVAPYAVRDSHYIKHDIPAAFFVTLAQVFAARLVVDTTAAERRRHWVWAGFMAGLAMSTHYYTFPVVLPVAAAAFVYAHRTRQTARAGQFLLWAAAGSVAGFAAASPFFFFELETVMSNMRAVREIDVDRALAQAGAFAYMPAYLRMLWSDAMGTAVFIAAVAGLVMVVKRDWRRALVRFIFPVVFLLFLANTVPMTRYVNAMLPSLAVAAAFCIGLSGKERLATAAAFFILIAGSGFRQSLRADEFYSQPDTRSQAREFIERTVPAGSTVLIQPHSIQLRASAEGMIEALRRHHASETDASVKFRKQLDALAHDTTGRPTYRLFYFGTITDNGLDPDKIYISPTAIAAAGSLQPLRDQQVAYVAVNRYNDGNPAFEPLQSALAREGRLLATFTPYRANASASERDAAGPFVHNTAGRILPALERPGPIVDIWRIN